MSPSRGFMGEGAELKAKFGVTPKKGLPSHNVRIAEVGDYRVSELISQRPRSAVGSLGYKEHLADVRCAAARF